MNEVWQSREGGRVVEGAREGWNRRGGRTEGGGQGNGREKMGREAGRGSKREQETKREAAELGAWTDWGWNPACSQVLLPSVLNGQATS